MKLSRRLHRTIGIVLILPMFGWAISGMVFFIKPGYQAAYAPLSVKKYPLQQALQVSAGDWQQATLINTVLGSHLLVEQGGVTHHLDPTTLQARPEPSAPDIKRLINDAISDQAERYGDIVSLDGQRATTTTGVSITLDWNNLRLSQYGRDTRIIDTIYRVHYLQWTPSSTINQILGFTGLLLILGLSILGLKLFLHGRR
ncbi:MAG: hypothetical protein HKN50_03985 [Gammaproteobacteria bacterium]|nr:hypothetical protein [Gammaproteobacteria bacterium]